MKVLSIIVPVLNEFESIPIFFSELEKIHKSLEEYSFEYWFIDDGSTDNTINSIRTIQKNAPYVHYISFSRNFGKEAALYAGLKNATGDYVVVMDIDLQDPPELLPEMLLSVDFGEWDAVGTRRTTRTGEPRIRTFFSDLFYKIINRISDTEFVNGARDYRVMSRPMVDAVLEMSEYNRFSKGIFSWVGFKTKYLEYKNLERIAGETSWSFWKLLKYSIEGIVSFSQVPLLLISILGFISFTISIILALFILVRALLFPGSAIDGWASMLIVILFFASIQLLSLGIIGRYIASIYLEVKNRPIYITKEKK